MLLPGFRWRDPEDDHDRKLLDDVRKYGCHIVGVFPDDHGPGFCFSIGLYLNCLHPEIIVTGLRDHQAAAIINDIASRARKDHLFRDGDTSLELAVDLPVTFREVDLDFYPDYLGYAMWFYSSLPRPFPCLQLVWPDPQGRFPWEPGFEERFRALQPLLFAPA